MALYWSTVFSIVAIAAALVGFGERTGPTGPAARIITIVCLALILLIAAGRLYLLRRERQRHLQRREHRRRNFHSTRRHSYR